ncbi:TIGR03619 family F420-dependent LLM class oxidoreductase [Zhongshania sp.]|uniref:TIGR03619 family F420-dependent LLM class oxidoreductase n=1 Tax=Zhongshania sp. TaxID=1971902 RepID=UPI0035625B83
MKFSYNPSMCPPEQYVPLALAAEELGFNSMAFPDSLCYPEHSSANYPYNGDGSREFLKDMPFVEPLVTIPFLAGQTKRLRFNTSVYKLAVRQPLVVAKQLATLAALCGDRFDFGVGISPWPEDFEGCHVPWAARGQRLDDQIEIIRGLLSGEFFSYTGKQLSIASMQLCPSPKTPIPILIGGHSDAALKRAAHLGDGWIGAGASIEEYGVLIGKLNEFRKQYQRDHLPFAIHVSSADVYSTAGQDALANLGVNECHIAFRNAYDGTPDTLSTDQKIDQMQKFAAKCIKP